MARWARDGTNFPDELYPGASPGWVAGCISWLANHPGERLPFGIYGDATDVYALAVEEACGWYPPPEPDDP